MEEISKDYKQIAKEHLNIMNRFNEFEEQIVIKQDNTMISLPNKVYYFEVFDNNEGLEYFNKIEINYQIPQTNKIVKIFLRLNKEVENYYNAFYKEWKEFKTDDNSLFWYNEKLDISTWENPIFVFISLVENKINPKWEIIDWEYLNDVSKLKINFRIEENESKTLLLNTKTKLITTNDSNLIEHDEDVPNENYLNQLKEKSYRNSLIQLNNKDNLPPVNVEDEKEIANEIKYSKEIEDFNLLLAEKRIEKFSNYEKELTKLIYDDRYVKLPAELRKQTFEKYQNNLKDEKQNNVPVDKRKGVESFKSLLKKGIESGNINVNTSFAEFKEKYDSDPSYDLISQREREFLFNEAKLKLKKLIEERKKKSVEKFKLLMTEKINTNDILDETTYKDIKKELKSHQDYKLITSSSERKSLINAFIEEAKKINKYKEKRGIHTSIDSSDKAKLERDMISEEFIFLLRDKIKYEISWEEAQRKLSSDSRWIAIYDETKKCELFKNFIHEMRENKKFAYKQLLEDKIGLNQEITWHEAQHMLQRDDRFKEVPQKEREIMFQEHTAYIQERITADFTQFLNETTLLDKDSPDEGLPFKELVNKLNSDSRCQRMYKHPDKRDKLIRSKIKSLKFLYEKKLREERKEAYKQRDTNSQWRKGNII